MEPTPPPTGLSLLPAVGDRRVATSLRKVSLVALRTLLEPAATGPLPSELSAAMDRLRPWLMTQAGARREPVLRALGSPDVLAPLLSIAARAIPGPEGLQRAVPQLLLQLAAGEPYQSENLLWDVPFELLVEPARGLGHRFAQPTEGMSLQGGQLDVRLHDGSLWTLDDDAPCDAVQSQQALHGLDGLPGVFAQLDTNPLAQEERHPDKDGNRLSLGDHPLAEWLEDVGQALGLVALALPELRGELVHTLRRLVPVGYLPEVHLSASYRVAPGLIYMTLHPSQLTLAEALVHETQHGKLNALSWLDPVLHNGHSDWAPSPVRPDLRPLMGVLLAVHAFAPVAAMHRRLAELEHPLSQTPEFETRRAQVLHGNQAGLETLLQRAKPSALGQRLLQDLERLQDYARDGRPLSTDQSDVGALPG